LSVTDVLETQFKLDASQYKREAGMVTSFNDTLGRDFNKLNGVMDAMRLAGVAAGVALAGIGIAAAGAFAAFKQYAAFESLENGLVAVEGNAKKAKQALEDLKRIARQPGIGYEEAVRGYAGLRRGGADAEFSQRAVAAAGNANAFAGGNVESFQRMMLAFGQILNKPFLQGEELMQLNEAGLPASRIIRERFGSADGNDLKKMGVTSGMALEALVEAMEKMPKAAGGAQNLLDNITDSLKFAMVGLGAGLASGVGNPLNSVLKTLDQLNSNKYFESLGANIGRIFEAVAGGEGEGLMKFANTLEVLSMAIADAMPDIMFWLKALLLTLGPVGIVALEKLKALEGDRSLAKAQQENADNFQAIREAQDKAKAETEKQKTEDQNSAQDPATQFLRKIEKNTAQALEIQKAAFGGGELARVGVTATEIRGKSNREKLAHQIGVVGLDMAFPVMRQTRRLGT
jgi:tape measure domain-containing protein